MEIDERVSNLEKYHLELATVVWGDNRTRDNGIRSEVRSIASQQIISEAQVSELSTKIRHYIDVEREETCHGLEAIKEHLQRHCEDGKEDVQVKVAKINRWSSSWVQFIQLAGILFLAFMTMYKK
jgi:hypothetical protein